MENACVEGYHCPRWQELPELPLYMDQVRLIIGKALSPLTQEDAPAVTAAMINNYVKMKLIPPAEKKKYVREHIARLILLCLLKKVLSLAEIAAVLAALTEQQGTEGGYDIFCEALEAQLKGAPVPENCPEILRAAIVSLVGKLQVERLVNVSAQAAEKPASREKHKEK